MNEKWAGMVVVQPAGRGLTSIEGIFKVPDSLTLSEGAPDGYNLVSIFVGLGDNGKIPPSLSPLEKESKNIASHTSSQDIHPPALERLPKLTKSKDNLPQLQAGISLMSQKKAGIVTTSHFAYYSLSSQSPSQQLALSEFQFNLNDTLRLSITSNTINFENFSTGKKFSKYINGTANNPCRNRPCIPPVKRSSSASTTGETGYWIVEEGASTGEQFGNFGTLEWKGASGNISLGAKVEAGGGDRWAIADANGTKVVEVAVINGEYFQVGLVA